MSMIALIPSAVGNFLWILMAFLIVLTIVVFVHEMGHFLVARWCGVKISTFSIGFGKEIAHRYDKHGTRWRIAWVPLGGYVKFAGDQNGASVPSREAIAAMSEEERAGSFHTKPLWQRAAVVAAGPIANFLLAIAIYAGIYSTVGRVTHIARVDIVTPGSPAAKAGFQPGDIVKKVDGSAIAGITELRRIEQFSGGTALTFTVERGGREVRLTATPEMKRVKVSVGGTAKIGVLGIETILTPPRVGNVMSDSAAAAAGLQKGDLVKSISGAKIRSFNDLAKIVQAAPGKPLDVVIERNGSELKLVVTPKPVKLTNKKTGKTVEVGRFGISAYRDMSAWTFKRYDPLSALWLGTKETYSIIARTLGYVGDIFKGKQSADQLGGPLMIAEVSGQAASRGLDELIQLIAYLSVSIGLINLFPIPLLDGGHLMFYAFEAVLGRPLGEKAQEIGFRIGLALVLLLMVFSTWNDIMRKISQFAGSG